MLNNMFDIFCANLLKLRKNIFLIRRSVQDICSVCGQLNLVMY